MFEAALFPALIQKKQTKSNKMAFPYQYQLGFPQQIQAPVRPYQPYQAAPIQFRQVSPQPQQQAQQQVVQHVVQQQAVQPAPIASFVQPATTTSESQKISQALSENKAQLESLSQSVAALQTQIQSLKDSAVPLWPIKIAGKDVPVTLAPGIPLAHAKAAVESRNFTEWVKNLDAKLTVKKIHIAAVDMFGPRVGFIKFNADIVDAQGAMVPGIVFMRGGAVAILPILHCQGTRYTLLTVQARVPIASAAFAEIPAGMLDGNENFAGIAAKEMEEETGIKLTKGELIDLSGLATPGSSGMFPSAGGCDEFIRLYAFERIVSLEQLRDLQGKLTGELHEGEKITLKVVKLENIPIETPDAKALSALQLYTYLVATGKIRPLA
eukprot:TRINITY_DN128_c0_g1_i1.p1 TRINITY_DN128_c0_g1~~TRINITY_DN128_c0_g1_i1.p1  ORF type:complete len:381 (-),score=93.28 TRINITY_DN128_c0_g1_i1:21-1163(-)